MMLILLWGLAPLWAGPFSIINRTSDLPSGNAIFTAISANADSLETTVNGGFLSEASRTTFNDAMAKGVTSQGNGLWVDRASNPDRFSVGVGLQAQVNMASLTASSLNFSTNNSLPPIGGGAMASLNVGLAPALLAKRRKSSDRFFFYFNGMYFSSTLASASVRMASIGVNAQYRLIQPKRFLLLGWGGITAATGLNYSNQFVGMNSKLQLTSTSDVAGQTVSVNIDMNYELGVRSNVWTIPLEVSTNFSLLYLFTFYLGGAADLNYGSASLSGTASGPVTASYTGGFGGSNLFSGTGSLNLDDGVTSRPTAIVGRAFAGLQFNFLLFKITGQYNYLTNGSHGLAVIARAAI